MAGLEWQKAWLGAGLTLWLSLVGGDAEAFTHVVKRGETLASVAEASYGRIQFEKLLVAANGLDLQGGTGIVPGMRLEIPALGHRRARSGDTWEALAEELLGGTHRAVLLSGANDTSPWLVPDNGAEIIVPYNLRIIARSGDTMVGIAYRFLGDRTKAWVLDHYNGRRGRRLERGDVVLVPLTDLPLTAAGKAEARLAAAARRSEGSGRILVAQRAVQKELPALISDIRGGRYVNAIARGNKFIASAPLTLEQRRVVHRQLLEAYAAVGAEGLARESCEAWRKNEPNANMDPNALSPKLLAACTRTAGPQ